jgi:hypothetical protein
VDDHKHGNINFKNGKKRIEKKKIEWFKYVSTLLEKS